MTLKSKLFWTVGLAVGLFAAAPQKAAAQCPGVCYHTCAFGLRIVTNGTPGNSNWEPDFTCSYGLCNSCEWFDDGDADVDAIDAAFDSSEFEDELVTRLFAREDAVLNVERSALQIMSKCTPGTVAIHIPLNLAQLALAHQSIPLDRYAGLEADLWSEDRVGGGGS